MNSFLEAARVPAMPGAAPPGPLARGTAHASASLPLTDIALEPCCHGGFENVKLRS